MFKVLAIETMTMNDGKTIYKHIVQTANGKTGDLYGTSMKEVGSIFEPEYKLERLYKKEPNGQFKSVFRWVCKVPNEG